MPFPPSVSDFKAMFTREFAYGTSGLTVMDNDIQRSLNEAGIVFNPDLWSTAQLGSTTEQNIAYLYVSAHFLALNVQGAGGLSAINRGRGVKSAGGGSIQSKSVGAVSVTYAFPASIQDSPILGQFMRTDFGQKYLALITPRLVGNVQVVSGVSFGAIDVLNTITPNPLQITTLSIPGGTNNVVYTTTLAATGGVGIYQWSVVSGTLPTGLVIGTLTGILSGTPTVAGTYYFEVQVQDNVGNQGRQNFQVVIA